MCPHYLKIWIQPFSGLCECPAPNLLHSGSLMPARAPLFIDCRGSLNTAAVEDFHTRFFYDTKPDYVWVDSFDSSCNCYSLDKACIYDIVGDGSCDGTNVEQYLAGVEVGTVEHCSGDQACIVEHCAEGAHGAKASKRAVPSDAISDCQDHIWSEAELEEYELRFMIHPTVMEDPDFKPAANCAAHLGRPTSADVGSSQVDTDRVGHTSMTVTPYDHMTIVQSQENQHNHFDVGSHVNAHTPPTFTHTTQDLAKAATPAMCAIALRNMFAIALCFAVHAACQADSSAENLKTMPKGSISLGHMLASRAMPLVAILTCISLAAIVCHMFPGNHNALRTPPSWGPELEGSYPSGNGPGTSCCLSRICNVPCDLLRHAAAVVRSNCRKKSCSQRCARFGSPFMVRCNN